MDAKDKYALSQRSHPFPIDRELENQIALEHALAVVYRIPEAVRDTRVGGSNTP